MAGYVSRQSSSAPAEDASYARGAGHSARRTGPGSHQDGPPPRVWSRVRLPGAGGTDVGQLPPRLRAESASSLTA